MQIIVTIKDYISNFVLNQKLKSFNREKRIHNLFTAKKIGIVFNATKQDSFDITRSFCSSLKQRGIDVEAIGYVDSKVIMDYYTARKGFSFFCRKDVNWFSKPRNPAIRNFLKKKYDILIDLTLADNFPTRYIVSLANAEFKAGRHEETNSPYDFMIDISKNNDLTYLVEQMKYYLSVINT